MNYNVLALPNPLGLDFISAQPKFKPVDVLQEANTMYSIIKMVASKYSNNISNLHTISVSYGGILSAIISYLDSSPANNLLKTITLISPPYNLANSLMLLDEYIDNAQTPFGVITLIPHVKSLKKYCSVYSDETITENDLSNLMDLTVYGGFYIPFIDSIKAFDNYSKLIAIPNNMEYGPIEEDYFAWRDNYRFKTYFDQVAPEVFKNLNSNIGDTMYWINRAKENGKAGIRILTADDGFRSFLNTIY